MVTQNVKLAYTVGRKTNSATCVYPKQLNLSSRNFLEIPKVCQYKYCNSYEILLIYVEIIKTEI